MADPLRICTACNASIPDGAMYCRACGAASPTEGVKPVFAVPGATERPSDERLDLDARRAEVQSALGAGFEATGLIGRGGFGEVWAAVDTQLGRAVAVKLLRPEVSKDPDFRKRFRREARAVARLRHPSIVPIYHVGETGGTVWFTMPLVEGVTLRAALGEPGGLHAQETVRILIEAADALREAHLRGIIHRDIKPENIMLEGPQRRVLLMDFGVAKVDEPGGSEGITEADVVFGSPEYMSPEQATARPLDARSDIYSLGVVAYRMLAGRLPFAADTPREILAHHVLTPPPPLTDRSSVPPKVAEAVMKCLAKAPEDRWQTVDEFARALAVAAPRASRLAASALVLPPLWARVSARMPGIAQRRPALLLLPLLVLLAAWPAVRWRQRRQWANVASQIAAQYRRGGDSLGVLAGAFARGELSAPRLALERTDLLSSTETIIGERFGAAVDDSAAWPAAARATVRQAAAAMASSGARVVGYVLRPGDVAGCALVSAGDTLRLIDNAPHDNCWFAAEGGGTPGSPVEYYARFHLAERPSANAGVGLAWCVAGGECRIAFVWPGATAVWGAHRPRHGLSALGLGKRTALARGDHELRVRWENGRLQCRLDGRLILARASRADSPFLERPASVDFVVQNTRVALVGPGALGAVGARSAVTPSLP